MTPAPILFTANGIRLQIPEGGEVREIVCEGGTVRRVHILSTSPQSSGSPSGSPSGPGSGPASGPASGPGSGTAGGPTPWLSLAVLPNPRGYSPTEWIDRNVLELEGWSSTRRGVELGGVAAVAQERSDGLGQRSVTLHATRGAYVYALSYECPEALDEPADGDGVLPSGAGPFVSAILESVSFGTE